MGRAAARLAARKFRPWALCCAPRRRRPPFRGRSRPRCAPVWPQLAAANTWEIRLAPPIRCSTFAVADFMRVPSPAARITIVVRAGIESPRPSGRSRCSGCLPAPEAAARRGAKSGKFASIRPIRQAVDAMAKFGAGGPPAEDAFSPYLLWGTLALCAVVLAAASIAITFGGRGDARSAAANELRSRHRCRCPRRALRSSNWRGSPTRCARYPPTATGLRAVSNRSSGPWATSPPRSRASGRPRLAIPTVAAAPPAQAPAAPRAA